MHCYRKQISGCLGMGRGTYGEGWKRRLQGYKETLGHMFTNLFVEMFSQVYIYVKIYQIIYFRNMSIKP